MKTYFLVCTFKVRAPDAEKATEYAERTIAYGTSNITADEAATAQAVKGYFLSQPIRVKK
jgi:hypothetical protein